MVAGKVKAAMGFQKSPTTPEQKATSRTGSLGSHKAPPKIVFSRSLGVYFPRSTQVQPRPPDGVQLVRLVEELQLKESRLRAELLQYKTYKESAAIVPVLEKEVSAKLAELEPSLHRIDCIEAENKELRREVEHLKGTMAMQEAQNAKKMMEMENEINELKRRVKEAVRVASKDEPEVGQRHSSSQIFQTPVVTNGKMNVQGQNGEAEVRKEDDEIPKERETNLKTEDTEGKPIHQVTCSVEVSGCPASSTITRAPRIPKPPPKPSSPALSSVSSSLEANIVPKRLIFVEKPKLPALPALPPPPPPPVPCGKRTPPPATFASSASAKVRRAPEVVEFYHSLMRRDSKKDSSGGPADAPSSALSTRNMIGEIENRSAHLLAIKTDVETQGDFIRFLIKEVENASFTDIENVVAFVKWLDDELSFLVDERAVLKHFDWPEQKADAMREAAFGYCDLKKLESEASTFCDDPRQPSGQALKKMTALLEKLEHGVYNLSRMRESATNRYKQFQIPSDWMLDAGIVSQIKLASVKLGMQYMKKVSTELESAKGGPEEEELMVQGVRFAFRVHQFAGGFDVETMRAFEEFRNKAHSWHLRTQNRRRQQKLSCGSTSC